MCVCVGGGGGGGGGGARAVGGMFHKMIACSASQARVHRTLTLHT